MDGDLLSATGISREKFLGASILRDEGGGRFQCAGFRVLGVDKASREVGPKPQTLSRGETAALYELHKSGAEPDPEKTETHTPGADGFTSVQQLVPRVCVGSGLWSKFVWR